MLMQCLVDMELIECPFCGKIPSFSGDDCVLCECGASVRRQEGKCSVDKDGAAAKWNNRYLSVKPQILKAAKIQDAHGAYLDLCSAQWKIENQCKINNKP